MAKVKPIGIGNTYLEFEINSDGNVKVEAYGFEGRKCRDATKDYESILGKVQTRTEKGGDRQYKVKIG